MMTTRMYKKEQKTLCHSQIIKSQHTRMHKNEQKTLIYSVVINGKH